MLLGFSNIAFATENNGTEGELSIPVEGNVTKTIHTGQYVISQRYLTNSELRAIIKKADSYAIVISEAASRLGYPEVVKLSLLAYNTNYWKEIAYSGYGVGIAKTSPIANSYTGVVRHDKSKVPIYYTK